MLKKLIVAAVAVCAAISVSAQAVQRYCNPLPMPVGQGGTAWGDVSVFLDDDGTYYMYCTGGGAWYSKDLVNWTFHYVDNVITAPDVHKYNGKYYMTGNDITIWESDSPLGPFKDMGPFKNTGGPELGWKVPFDSMLFIDDDNTPYLFWPGRGRTGIYGVELDKNDLTKFVSTPTHLFSYNPMHWFEHFGEHNEYRNVSWIEGPWVIKKDGVYYCAYSCSGTQWKTYAAGYYTADKPLGPYTFGNNNPLLRNTEGLVTGPSHGSIIQDKDGEWWAFYTVVLGTPPGGRKIGMDRIVFDEYGNMTVKVTDTPQPVPGTKNVGAQTKSYPLSVAKVARGGRNMQAPYSSEQPGFFASYAFDDYNGTWWKPDPADKEPYVVIDLSPADGVNVIDLFKVDGLRILFGGSNLVRRTAQAAPPRANAANRPAGQASAQQPRPVQRPMGSMFAPAGGLPVYKYKLEGSMDGVNYFMLLDRTQNVKIQDVVYDDIEPTECRYVKLTITGWPEGIDLGILDATVFGKYSSFLPPTNPQENDRYLYNY